LNSIDRYTRYNPHSRIFHVSCCSFSCFASISARDSCILVALHIRTCALCRSNSRKLVVFAPFASASSDKCRRSSANFHSKGIAGCSPVDQHRLDQSQLHTVPLDIRIWIRIINNIFSKLSFIWVLICTLHFAVYKMDARSCLRHAMLKTEQLYLCRVEKWLVLVQE